MDLEADLKNLGIIDAFEPNSADFSNMANIPIHVGAALHKSNIDFSEKGIKAAATTVIIMTANSIMANEDIPVEIKIDKPFIYFIRDKKTNEIWFVGTVYEPNSLENNKIEY